MLVLLFQGSGLRDRKVERVEVEKAKYIKLAAGCGVINSCPAAFIIGNIIKVVIIDNAFLMMAVFSFLSEGPRNHTIHRLLR